MDIRPAAGDSAGDYEMARLRHVQAFEAGLPVEIARISAPLREQHELRDERLGALLRHAREHSPWHRERLAGIDLDAITGDDLSALPPMTKADLMEGWDEIVCDRRLSLAMVNDHLERIAREGPSYLLGEYHAVATGGSTGRRGVVVWDFEGFRLVGSRGPAWGIAAKLALDVPFPLPMTAANIGSVNPIHAGGAIMRCFSSSKTTRLISIAASLPIEEIAAELEKLQPRVIVGYASVLHQLALLELDGRLSLEPAEVVQGGEPFLPEAQDAVARAFETAVVRDIWGASEVGFGASSFPGFEGLVLSEDLVIVEPVDEGGAPVRLGERAAKILVTNLANRVLPIIRYELSDEVTMGPPHAACPWKGHRLLTIHGRQDDVFRYADRVIHPHTFRSVLTRSARVAEYQVRQTPRGAEVSVVQRGAGSTGPLQQELCAALERAGLAAPEVHVEAVPVIARHPDSQKLKRFVPM